MNALKLVDFNITFGFQILNFIVLYLLLKRFLFKPVTSFMDNRTKNIEESINAGEAKYKEAIALKDQYEEKLKEIKVERNQVIDEATQRADARSQQIVGSAEEDARKILERARLQIEREKQKMMNELKEDIAQLAIAAAGKIIEKDLDKNTHQKMIQQFIDKAGEAKWQN